MTLSSATPPLSEVLKLWDFYFAHGVHLNIICIAAQLIKMRKDILEHPSPVKLLRSFPSLDAAYLIEKTREYSKLLPTQLDFHLQRHVFDLSLVHRIIYTNKIK
eukprot:NODE_237_length_13348_cov_0.297381.p8 type:complete len:104 gc:universal NODE_237_length_13348_cov_0.297381:12490-12179(-)